MTVIDLLTMNVDSFWWRVVNIFFCESCHQILTNDTVQSPTFVTPGYFLSHSRQKSLRVEKPGDPKYLEFEGKYKCVISISISM